MKNEDLPSHPSHGILSINRVSGNGTRFFGSPVECNHFIDLEISEGRAWFNDVSGTHYSDGKAIVKVRMTPTQWAEAITTLNSGPGVPCTITRRCVGPFEFIEEPPLETSEAIRIRDGFVETVEEKLATLGAMKRRILSHVDAARMAQGKRDEISRELDAFFKLFADSAPFMMGIFQEATDAAVADAKAVVMAFVEHQLRTTGLAALEAGGAPVTLELATGRKEDR